MPARRHRCRRLIVVCLPPCVGVEDHLRIVAARSGETHRRRRRLGAANTAARGQSKAAQGHRQDGAQPFTWRKRGDAAARGRWCRNPAAGAWKAAADEASSASAKTRSIIAFRLLSCVQPRRSYLSFSRNRQVRDQTGTSHKFSDWPWPPFAPVAAVSAQGGTRRWQTTSPASRCPWPRKPARCAPCGSFPHPRH